MACEKAVSLRCPVCISDRFYKTAKRSGCEIQWPTTRLRLENEEATVCQGRRTWGIFLRWAQVGAEQDPLLCRISQSGWLELAAAGWEQHLVQPWSRALGRCCAGESPAGKVLRGCKGWAGFVWGHQFGKGFGVSCVGEKCCVKATYKYTEIT